MSHRFNPFPGLRPFESSEARVFFGREGQSAELLRLLRHNRFVTVVGPSGSGKSSLVRAGLLPALYGGFMSEVGSDWRIALLRPGSDPIGNLAHALNSREILGTDAGDPTLNEAFIQATLRRGALGLVEAATQAHLPAKDNLLVVVDQFEEIFRFQRASREAGYHDDAAAFVRLLLEGAAQREVPIYVLLTMRSDYLGDCAQFRDLPEAINRGQYLIPRMKRDERRLAITGPVAVGGGTIAPRLVNRLLNDAGDDPDQLPILQHALMRTWDRWAGDHASDEPLDLRHYEAIGGIGEALSRHADEAYGELPDERARTIAEKVFRRLTERGSDNREIRRPTRFAELCAVADADPVEARRVIDTFRVEGRSFLVPAAEIELESQTLVDISHESLIRGWTRLRQWVDEEAESAHMYRRLGETAMLHRAGRAGLWHDPELQLALEWWERDRPNAAWARSYDDNFEIAAAFLAASREARDAELAARRRRHRRTVAGLAAGLLAMTCLTAVAIWKEREATRSKLAADLARDSLKVASDSLQATGDSLQATLLTLQSTNRRLDASYDSLRVAAALLEAQRAAAERAARDALAAQRRAEESERWALVQARLARKSSLEGSSTAVDLADAAIALAPLEATLDLRSTKALQLGYLGRDSDALTEFGKVLDVRPGLMQTRVNRSDAYLNAQRPDSALMDADFVVQQAPHYFLAHLNRAMALSLLRRYADADSAFVDALDAARYVVTGTGQSLVSPSIRHATRQTRLALPRGQVPVALAYGRASLHAFDGDGEFQPRLAEADARLRAWSGGRSAGAAGRPLDALLAAINWTWLHHRYVTQDYGALAAEGALWERAGERFHDDAVRAYEAFVQAARQRPDPRYARLGRWVDVRLAALRPAGVTPMSPEPPAESPDIQTLLVQADEYRARGESDSVLLTVDAALAQEPDSTEAAQLLVDRAAALVSLISALDRRIDDLPQGSRSDAAAERDSLLAEQRELLERARSDAQAALRRVPTLARAYRTLVDVESYELSGLSGGEWRAKWEEILGDVDNTLRYDPLQGWPYWWRALSLMVLYPDSPDSLASAASTIRRGFDAVDWLSGKDQVHATLATLEHRMGHVDAARDAYRAAIALRGDTLAYRDSLVAFDSIAGEPPREVGLDRVRNYVEAGDIRALHGDPAHAADAYVAAAITLLRLGSGQPDPALDYGLRETIEKMNRVVVAWQGSEVGAADLYCRLPESWPEPLDDTRRARFRALLLESAGRLRGAGRAPCL